LISSRCFGAAPTVTTYTYNAANQLTGDGTTTYTYDPNGNLTTGATWDRANRMRSVAGADYAYDGEGRRVRQTIAAQVTQYLLDVQPGLSVVLSATQGANVNRYVHGPRGIHAQKDASGAWEWMQQDGLGSVRNIVDNGSNLLWSTNYDPFGNGIGAIGTPQTNYGFTGELVDGGGLLDLRAWRYNTGIGIFASLDPFEGLRDRAMSLNGYSWVEGNTPNAVAPSGLSRQRALLMNSNMCSYSGGGAEQGSSCICYCNPEFSTYSEYNCQVCNAFRDGLAIAVDGSQFTYCDGRRPSRACCEPDITSWLMRELQIQGTYAATPGSLIPSTFSENATGQSLFRLAIYGLAVDYGYVEYRGLAVRGAQMNGQYIPSETDYSCSARGVVSICGACQNSTDLGNFILGFAIARANVGEAFADVAGPIFNLMDGDTTATADNLGVEIGFNFGQMGNYSTTSSFCDAWRSLGTAWHDSKPSSGCSTPCSIQNLDCAPNSVPDWNGFVSVSLGGTRAYATPVDYFIDLTRKFINSRRQ
jgi:RHS repeat-associated protein